MSRALVAEQLGLLERLGAPPVPVLDDELERIADRGPARLAAMPAPSGGDTLAR